MARRLPTTLFARGIYALDRGRVLGNELCSKRVQMWHVVSERAVGSRTRH